MLSLIVGWIIDAYAGYLFRYIMKNPIQTGYCLAYHKDHKDVPPKIAEEEFDKARDRIDLKNVDRFYYRYVFSRNMYTTQLALMLVTLLLLICSKATCNCISFLCFVVGIMIFLLFIPIVKRDLTTHVKYVFLEDKEPNS